MTKNELYNKIADAIARAEELEDEASKLYDGIKEFRKSLEYLPQEDGDITEDDKDK